MLISKPYGLENTISESGPIPGLYVNGEMYRELTLADCGTDASGVKALITQPNTEVILPKGVTSIGDAAFMDCTSLASVTIPEGITSIGDYAFSNTSIANITLPNSLVSLNYTAFRTPTLGNVYLQSVTVNGVTFSDIKTSGSRKTLSVTLANGTTVQLKLYEIGGEN